MLIQGSNRWTCWIHTPTQTHWQSLWGRTCGVVVDRLSPTLWKETPTTPNLPPHITVTYPITSKHGCSLSLYVHISMPPVLWVMSTNTHHRELGYTSQWLCRIETPHPTAAAAHQPSQSKWFFVYVQRTSASAELRCQLAQNHECWCFGWERKRRALYTMYAEHAANDGLAAKHATSNYIQTDRHRFGQGKSAASRCSTAMQIVVCARVEFNLWEQRVW